MKIRAAALCIPFALLPVLLARAQPTPDWTAPIAPFRIADNLYYVGSRDLASYLIVTPAGDILINSNLVSSPPLIVQSIAQLGFRIADVKILLISHAHYDHAGGSKELLRLSHAQYMVMDDDAPVVESGGAKDFAYPHDRYPSARVDRVLHDGDQVTLGVVALTAHKTPGHTRGCTTWTMRATSGGQPRDVVIVGSWNVNSSYRLVDRPGSPASYPGIAADYQHSFAVLSALPCDIFLGAHGSYFHMLGKLARAPSTDPESIWIDPTGYRRAVAERQQEFEAELKRQQTTP
ncbi:MAG: subclass B3 metallo-beta-lactamase [Acidobacteriaceae bacterium]|jgi:metallo-beta-lactamase class B